MYQYTNLQEDLRESQTEREHDEAERLCEWPDERRLSYTERDTIRQIRDCAFYAVGSFDRGRIDDAIADMTFIHTLAERLLK